MNYEEARVYLEQVSKYGSVLGLENMKALLDRLDNPQDELKFIHISGTNGKGSVLAYLSSILQEAIVYKQIDVILILYHMLIADSDFFNIFWCCPFCCIAGGFGLQHKTKFQ